MPKVSLTILQSWKGALLYPAREMVTRMLGVGDPLLLLEGCLGEAEDLGEEII